MKDSDIEAMLDALRSGWLTMGPRIAAFETEFAAYVGAPLAVAVSSGNSALHLAVRAVAEPGAEIIVPAIGGDAAAAAARAAGVTPVFADVVSADNPTLGPDLPITAKTAAVVAVHAFGLTAAIPDVDVPVIEDARAALGTGVGTQTAVWSFADGRPLGMGEGGMVTTADETLAARVKLLRAHAMTSGTWDRHRGHSDSYDVVDIGFNFRLDEPRAALGSAQLSHLDEDLADRPLRTAFVVEDTAGVLERLAAAGVPAAAVTALADLPNATAAAQRLVALRPGADVAAASAAL